MTETQKQKTEQIAGWIVLRLVLGAILFSIFYVGMWYIQSEKHADWFSIVVSERALTAVGYEIVDIISNRDCVLTLR